MIDNYGGVPPGYTYTQGVSEWGSVETSSGVYDWSLFDLVWAKLISKGVTDVVFSFQGLPSWWTITDTTSVQTWVTAYLTRAALDGLPIRYVEGVNEANNGSPFWTGTVAQLVAVQQAIYTAARAYDASIKVLSPPINVVGTLSPPVGGISYLDTFLTAGGGAYCDIIAFHGYWSGTQTDYAADLVGLKAMLATHGLSAKPIWNTEYSSLSGVPATDVTYLAVTSLLDWSGGVSRKFYYAYDAGSPSDILWSPPNVTGPNGALNVAGVAYQEMVKWMNGAVLALPAGFAGVVGTCGFTRGGYQALAVWTSDGSTPTYTKPSWATQYHDVAGNVTGSLGSTVTLGANPILLENMNVF